MASSQQSSAQFGAEFISALIETGTDFLTRRLRSLCDEVGAMESSIMRPRNDTHLMFLAATNPALLDGRVPPVPIAMSFAGVVFRTGQLIATANASSQPGHFSEVDKVVGVTTREFAAIPIGSGRAPIGILNLVNRSGSPSTVKPFQVDELQRAQRAAVDIAGPLAILSSIETRVDDQARPNDELFTEISALNREGHRLIREMTRALSRQQGT